MKRGVLFRYARDVAVCFAFVDSLLSMIPDKIWLFGSLRMSVHTATKNHQQREGARESLSREYINIPQTTPNLYATNSIASTSRLVHKC